MNGNEPPQQKVATQARFPSQTQWTALVQPAADPASPNARQALNLLCQDYWFPVYAFLRSQRIDSHQAKDLTQDFFVHLIEGNLIQRADRERGRFRSFLLACLRHFLTDEWRKENAVKRGGRAAFVSMDDADAEEKYNQMPVTQPTPEMAFDRTWAAAVIEQATRRLQQSYSSRGRLDVFDALKRCLKGELPPESYGEVSGRLGMTKDTFEVNVNRFKKAFGAMVREVIAQTVVPSEVNEEVTYLMAAWSASLNERP